MTSWPPSSHAIGALPASRPLIAPSSHLLSEHHRFTDHNPMPRGRSAWTWENSPCSLMPQLFSFACAPLRSKPRKEPSTINGLCVTPFRIKMSAKSSLGCLLDRNVLRHHIPLHHLVKLIEDDCAAYHRMLHKHMPSPKPRSERNLASSPSIRDFPVIVDISLLYFSQFERQSPLEATYLIIISPPSLPPGEDIVSINRPATKYSLINSTNLCRSMATN